ncbi:MAG: hypothetical protein AAF726_08505 [Planctomycetota bacterium]
MSATTPRKVIDVALGAAVVLVLAAPGALGVLRGGENVARAGKIERHRPPERPGVPRSVDEALEWPARFDAWFEDAWGGRERALRVNARVSMKAFGTSPSEQLVFGRNDWVFSREHDSFESFAGVAPLGPGRLRDWQQALEDRRRWLAERGVDHLVVLVPHKSSIYPEELPANIERARGTSRLEEFLAHMEANSEVRVLAIADALRARKGLDGPWQHAYSPHGVQWTAVGAHAAYEVVARVLAEEHGAPQPTPLDGFRPVDREGEGDSWASRMYLDGVIDMENLRLVPRGDTGVVDAGRPPRSAPKDRRWTHPDRSRPRVVVAHDSFGPDLLPLLALSTSYLEARRRAYLEAEVVERARPDVVIELYSEVALVTQQPFRRPVFLGDEITDQFEAAEVLRTVDLGRALPVVTGVGAPYSRVVPEGVEVGVERGVGFVALGSIPRVGPRLAATTDVLLGLEIRSERPGPVGVYRGHRIDRSVQAEDLLPLEVGPETGRIVVPLPRAEPGASIWLALTPAVGTVTLHGVQVRRGPAR